MHVYLVMPWQIWYTFFIFYTIKHPSKNDYFICIFYMAVASNCSHTTHSTRCAALLAIDNNASKVTEKRKEDKGYIENKYCKNWKHLPKISHNNSTSWKIWPRHVFQQLLKLLWIPQWEWEWERQKKENWCQNSHMIKKWNFRKFIEWLISNSGSYETKSDYNATFQTLRTG